MKKDKKMFILIQAVLSLLVILLVVVMLREQSGKEQYQVSVIVENSDDNQWSAFKYGLKMAAEDRGAEMFMVSTGAVLTPEEEKADRTGSEKRRRRCDCRARSRHRPSETAEGSSGENFGYAGGRRIAQK